MDVAWLTPFDDNALLWLGERDGLSRPARFPRLDWAGFEKHSPERIDLDDAAQFDMRR
jgi:hypothetical protein